MSGARVVTQRLEPAGGKGPSRSAGDEVKPPDWLRLRPRNVGELLDQSFAVYVEYFGLLVGFALLCFVPLHLFFDAALSPAIQREGFELYAGLLRDVMPAALTSGLVTMVVGSRILGRSSSFGSHARRVLLLLPALLAFYVLRGVVSVVLCCFFVVPGMLSMWFLSPALAVYLLEGPSLNRMLPALRRALKLSWSWDGFGRFLGAGLIAALLITAPLLGISSLSESADLRSSLLSSGALDPSLIQLLMVLLGAAGVAAGAVFFDIFFTLYYFDLRVRREALDLELELSALQKRSSRT